MVRKIFYLLFPIIFLLVSFSFLPQKIFAQTCSSLGGSCGSPTSSSCDAGTTMVPGATDCLGGVCCKTSTSNSTTSSIPLGQYGCSFKNDGPKTIVIACASGGICVPIPPQATFDPSTNTYSNGYCVATGNQCPVCDAQHQINNQGSCSSISNANDTPVAATKIACAAGEGCDPGFGCSGGSTSDKAPPLSLCQNGVCKTALGDLPTDLPGLLTRVFSIALSLAGVVALGLIIASGYRLMISQGNPEQVKGAREQLTAAIIGLLFIIFSLVILQIIGVNILKIPGFSAN